MKRLARMVTKSSFVCLSLLVFPLCVLNAEVEEGWFWEKHAITSPKAMHWEALACSANADKIYAGGTESYVYTSSDGGDLWTAREPGGNWTRLATSSDGSIVIGGTYPGNLYLSTDSGVTWANVDPEDSNAYWTCASCSSDGTRLFVGQYRGYLYLSSDIGATWTRHDPTGGIPDVIWSFTAASDDARTLLAGVYDGKIYTSSTGGGTWTQREPAAGNRNWSCGTVSGEAELIVVGEEYGYLYASSDGGATWTELRPDGESKSWTSVDCSDDGSTIVAAAAGSSLFISHDGGGTWMALSPIEGNNDWNAVRVSSAASTIIAATDGGDIYISTDSGESWSVCDTGNFWSAVACSADVKTVLAGGAGTALYLSTDEADSWTPITTVGENAWGCAAVDTDGSVLYAGVYGGPLYASTDSGATWNPLAGAGEKLWVALACSDDGSKAVVGAGGAAPGPLLVSSDSGAAWSSPLSFEAYWSDAACSSDGSVMIVGASGDYVYLSIDSGATWTQTSPSGDVGLWTGVTTTADGRQMAVCAYKGYLHTSTDGGTTWTQRDPAGETKKWKSIRASADGTNLAAATEEGGIWVSTDFGETWTQNLPGDTPKLWNGLASSADGSKLVACVYGGGVYTGKYYEKPSLLTLGVSPSSNYGTTDPAPGEHAYDFGDTITITAVPATGYAFIGWTASAEAEIANPAAVTTTLKLNGDQAEAIANFAIRSISIGSFSAKLDGKNSPRNSVKINNAELTSLPEGFDPIISPIKSTATVFFDNSRYDCVNNTGEWKRYGKEGSYRYTFTTRRKDSSSHMTLTLDTKKNLWHFHVKEAEFSSLNSADDIAVMLMLKDECNGGLFHAEDNTSWKYSLKYQTIPEIFAVSRLSGNYNSNKENTDSFHISRAFTGSGATEFGDVTIRVNRSERSIAADKFSNKKAGVYEYDSKKDPDYAFDDHLNIKINLNNLVWSASLSKANLNKLIGDIGVMEVSLVIGDYETPIRELQVDQKTRIKYKRGK